MKQWILYIFCSTIFIKVCRSLDSGVCKKYDICNDAVYNNVSYTCERKYMKSTRCQLITLTKVIDIMETQMVYSEFEEGLSALDKAIKSLSCQLQSRPYCELNGDCHSDKVQGKCGDSLNIPNNSNNTEVKGKRPKTKQRCQDGFSFHCNGRELGTNSKWCFKHCSVGWAQCNEYCNCTCLSNQLPITTPVPLNISIPKCNRHMKLTCKGKLDVIPSNWCNSYCRRNGPLCLKYCNCECVRKNVKGFFTRHSVPQTTTVYTTIRSTEILKSTIPTFTRNPTLITCRIGFDLHCVSSNRLYSSQWCTVSCKRRDCPTHCSCKCELRRSSGFLTVRTDQRNTKIKYPKEPNKSTSTPRTSTTLTTTTTASKRITTIPTKLPKPTKAFVITRQASASTTTTTRPTTVTITPESTIASPTPRTTSTTTPMTTTKVLSTLKNSPYLDMCSKDFIFKCRGKQFGIRHEWCTKQCMTGSSNCKLYCVCGCVRVKNATIQDVITTNLPEFDFVTTTPAIIVTKVTNFCHEGHISCKWKGPNLGPVNHDMLKWCQDVCSVNSDHCSELRHMCECRCLRFKKRVKICRPSEQMKHNPAISAWCRRNCIAGYCPKTHCSCEFVLI